MYVARYVTKVLLCRLPDHSKQSSFCQHFPLLHHSLYDQCNGPLRCRLETSVLIPSSHQLSPTFQDMDMPMRVWQECCHSWHNGPPWYTNQTKIIQALVELAQTVNHHVLNKPGCTTTVWWYVFISHISLHVLRVVIVVETFWISSRWCFIGPHVLEKL